MLTLTYANTHTFLVGGLLVDTGYAGTWRAFCRALKEAGADLRDVRYVMVTHWHPDHAGLVGEITRMGPRLLLPDTQRGFTGFPDRIFERDGLTFVPVDESAARIVSCGESRGFLAELGIAGEIVSAPSHSPDSVCLALDSGECIAGDLEPYEHIPAYGEDSPLARDWERLLALKPKRIFWSHRPSRPAPPCR